MAYTDEFTVDAVGDPEAIQVITTCRKVVVQEKKMDESWPTKDFNFMAPDKTSVKVRLSAGSDLTFVAPDGTCFASGAILGWIETLSGSATFIRMEL